MGAVGAEAKGLVRLDLARVMVRDGQTVAHRVSAFMDAQSACFNKGRRMSVEDVEAVDRFVKQAPSVAISERGRVFYTQAQQLKTMRRGGAAFDEITLEVRALKPELSRRRLAFWDYTLGVQFTAHSLGRVVERDGLRSGIAEHVLAQTIEALNFLVLLRVSCDALTTFAAPFAGGLILGDFARLDHITPSEEFASDRAASGYESPKTRTVWEDEAGDIVGFRVATYISSDALRPEQEGLLEEWRKVNLECGDVLHLVTLGAMAPDFENHAELSPALDRVMPSFSRLLASDSWRASTTSISAFD